MLPSCPCFGGSPAERLLLSPGQHQPPDGVFVFCSHHLPPGHPTPTMSSLVTPFPPPPVWSLRSHHLHTIRLQSGHPTPTSPVPISPTPITSSLVTPLPSPPHRSPPLQPLPHVSNTKLFPALSFPSCSAFPPWEAHLARCSPVHSLLARLFAPGSLALPIPTLHPNAKTISLHNPS